MKKINSLSRLSAFLAAILILAGVLSAGMKSSAVSPVKLTVSSITAAPGTDIVISVNISENSGLAAATFLLAYDTDKLTYKISAAGPAASGGLSSINPNYAVNGSIKTINDSFISSPAITAGGSMLNVTFTVKAGWTGTTPVTLVTNEFIDSTYNPIPKTVINGSVTVGSAPATTTEPASTSSLNTTSSGQTTAGETTASGSSAAVQTTVPVSVPVEDVVDALGPDGKSWDKNIDSLNDEQKEKIENYFADAGTPVTIAPDGIYYIQTTAADISALTDSTTKLTDNTAAKPSNFKAVIAAAVVGVILAAAFCIAYIKRKKSKGI